MAGYWNAGLGFTTGDTSGFVPVFNWDYLVVEPFRKVIVKVAGFIPDFILAIFTLVIGWVVARLLQLVATSFLGFIGFDRFSKKIGFSDFLAENEQKQTPCRWTGLLVFWIAFLSSLVLALGQLHLNFVSGQLDSLLGFFGVLFAALVIFIVGMLLSLAFAQIVRAVAQNIKMKKPELYADITKWVILAITAVACLSTLGLPSHVFGEVLGVAFLTLCIAFVLAFGLGGRAWAGKILDKIK